MDEQGMAADGIYAAINRVMQEVPFITKDGENKQQGFRFRGIDQVYQALHPAFIKCGVFCVQKVEDQKMEQVTTKAGTVMHHVVLRVRHTFYTMDGSSVDATTVGEAMDAGDKAHAKAMSVAMKYAAFSTFCIPTGEPDADEEAHEIAPHTSTPTRPQPATTPKTASGATQPPPANAGQGILPAGAGIKVLSVHEDEEGKISSVVFSNVYCHSLTKDIGGIKLGGVGTQAGECDWLSFNRKDGSPTGLECSLAWKGVGTAKVPTWLLEGDYAKQPLASVWADYQRHPQPNEPLDAQSEPLDDDSIPF